MDNRAPLGVQRPHLPQRAVSGGPYGLSRPAPKRPTLQTGLSNVRSSSQPAHLIDLTSDVSASEQNNLASFWGNKEKVVGSPDVINLEDDDGEPPVKRAKTSGQDFKTVEDDLDEDVKDEALEIAPGSPLPSLPITKPVTKRLAGQRRHRFGVEIDARKPHGSEPPALATRIPPPKKVADFSPWTGNHPEDILNENVIKSGFFDKAPASNQAESNSAKATIWPSLSQKNHHGLGLLGHMFTAVMEKRQAIGRSTAPSTFKPPPRLTLPDTKREAWLRDLANSEVPLRKLSRTIPYGVRGKLLMEQCLSKVIPLQRAVWLAKCVGANELRACRRKGISGSAAACAEFKWVREWTIHVEQFLEDIVSTCGIDEWQKKMNYAVKLATAFYSEKLLDMEHYLDWIVSSFATTTSERLPVWIILIQIYWKEITQYGRRGRKMAEGIMEHLSRIAMSTDGANAAVKMRLQKLVAILAISNRGCLILPKTWTKYKYLLTPTNDNSTTSTTASNIAIRNERLTGNFNNNAGAIRNALLDLYTELDEVKLDVDIDLLSEKCLEYIPVISELVPALFNWASTPYRTGVARIYLTSRVLAYLQNSGQDTDLHILQYLRDSNDLPSSGVDNIHRVIVDLVRQNAFSVGRYLQWLITSGVLSTSGEPTCATGLIYALPTASLSLQVLNTRKTIMRRLGTSMDETKMFDQVLQQVENMISASSTDHIDPIVVPEELSTSARFGIGQQILAKISITVKESGIGLGVFEVARNVIAGVRDISCLSALLSTASTTSNCALLATITDTVNLYADSFAALGELRRLVEGLSEQYLLLRSQQPLDRPLISSLTSLAGRVEGKEALYKLLRDDLAIYDQQSSLAVCSPASDSLIGMHAGSLDSDDDIDAVFASGNTMDEHLMQRVFTRIMQRASKLSPPGPEPVSRVGGWLNQLRSVDGGDVLDRLVKSYLQGLLKSVTEETASYPTTSLVSSGCIELGAVADIAKDIKSPQVAMALLPTFLASEYASEGLHESERYKYLLQQEHCQTLCAESLITIIRTACESQDFDAENQDLHRFLIRRVSAQPGSVRRIFESATSSDLIPQSVGRLVFAILHRGRRDKQMSNEWDIPSLISFASPLSIKFCKGVLQYFRSSTTFNTVDEDGLAEALLRSFKDQSEVWPQLLEAAGETVNRTVFLWAQEQLLSMATSKSANHNDEMLQHMNRCLDVLTVTSRLATIDDASGSISTITERLKELDKEVLEFDIFDNSFQRQRTHRLYQLQICLHLCVTHLHGSSGEDEASNRGKYHLLASLCSLLANPKLQTHQDLVEYLFDLASALSDTLPDVAQTLAKMNSISKLPYDVRFTSILGVSFNATDSWLALASQVLPPGSQQQRVLSRHPSQQIGAQVPASRSSSQSMQSQSQHQRFLSQNGPGFLKLDNKLPVETKTTPFPLRRWEIMPDPTPVMGENDSSLSLALFGARKV